VTEGERISTPSSPVEVAKFLPRRSSTEGVEQAQLEAFDVEKVGVDQRSSDPS
jgi:hypothetical protein